MDDNKCTKCKNLLPFTTNPNSVACPFCGLENELTVAKPHSWPKSIGSKAIRSSSGDEALGVYSLTGSNDCGDSGSDC
jgi:hypothetical protein